MTDRILLARARMEIQSRPDLIVLDELDAVAVVVGNRELAEYLLAQEADAAVEAAGVGECPKGDAALLRDLLC